MSRFIGLALIASIVLPLACKSDSATSPNEPVASVVVEPASSNLQVGATLQLRATLRDRHNNVLHGRTVTWSSNASTVASVTSSGSVRALDDGPAIITATSEGKDGTASVVVTSAQVPVAHITLDPTSANLTVGDQIQFTATPRDANGNPLSGRAVVWTSSDATVASVTQGGMVTALRAETATIHASSEGKTAMATVVVTAPDYGYDLIHSGWPDFPWREWRLYRTSLGGGPSELVLPPEVLPDLALIQAAVSPDGLKIAFTGWHPYAQVAHIFVVNHDGSDLRQLTFGGAEEQPTWSPDGAKIAYLVRPRGVHGDIWVMNADGTNPVNLTGSMNALNQFSPAWSRELPGGSRIVFGEGDGTYSNLWTMRPDGSDRRRVTSGTQWWDDDPSWSPDGSRIVFMREGPGTEGWFDIWVVDATGANAASLVHLPRGQTFPEWSPDGQWIAFNSNHAEDPLDWWVVYTVSSDGTNLTRRTYDPWMVTRAVWSARR